MAVPSSGTLSLLKIFSEKNEDDYTANNADGNNSFSLKGLSVNGTNDSSGGDISVNFMGMTMTLLHLLGTMIVVDLEMLHLVLLIHQLQLLVL